MPRKTVWLVLSCLLAVSAILSSCRQRDININRNHSDDIGSYYFVDNHSGNNDSSHHISYLNDINNGYNHLYAGYIPDRHTAIRRVINCLYQLGQCQPDRF